MGIYSDLDIMQKPWNRMAILAYIFGANKVLNELRDIYSDVIGKGLPPKTIENLEKLEKIYIEKLREKVSHAVVNEIYNLRIDSVNITPDFNIRINPKSTEEKINEIKTIILNKIRLNKLSELNRKRLEKLYDIRDAYPIKPEERKLIFIFEEYVNGNKVLSNSEFILLMRGIRHMLYRFYTTPDEKVFVTRYFDPEKGEESGIMKLANENIVYYGVCYPNKLVISVYPRADIRIYDIVVEWEPWEIPLSLRNIWESHRFDKDTYVFPINKNEVASHLQRT